MINMIIWNLLPPAGSWLPHLYSFTCVHSPVFITCVHHLCSSPVFIQGSSPVFIDLYSFTCVHHLCASPVLITCVHHLCSFTCVQSLSPQIIISLAVSRHSSCSGSVLFSLVSFSSARLRLLFSFWNKSVQVSVQPPVSICLWVLIHLCTPNQFNRFKPNCWTFGS